MRNRSVWLASAALGCLALAGCYSPTASNGKADGADAAPAPTIAAIPPPPALEPAPTVPPRKPVAAKKPAAPSKPTQQQVAAKSEPAKADASPPPARQVPPVQLVGLDETQLISVLGMPAEQQDKAPGKMWRYRSQSCTLDISLFPDVDTRTFRALAYEVMTNDNTTEGKLRCLSERHVSAVAR